MEKIDAIFCVVQRGKADEVVKAGLDAGAQGATVFYARGTGVRQKLGFLGNLIQPEKEVIFIVTRSENSERVFNAMAAAGKLDKPGNGFIFAQKVERAMGFLG
jgi:nitrogen regulatory protein PII